MRALEKTDYQDPFQSRFRLGDDIGTALVTLVDDLGQNSNSSNASIHVLLGGFQYHHLWYPSVVRLHGSIISPLLYNIYMKRMGDCLQVNPI